MFSHFKLLEEKWYLSINWHEKEGKSWLVGKKMSALLNHSVSVLQNHIQFFSVLHIFNQT